MSIIIPQGLFEFSESSAGARQVTACGAIWVGHAAWYYNTPVPLLNADLDLETGEPHSGNWLGFSQDETSISIKFQQKKYQREGLYAPSAVRCFGWEFEISGKSLSVYGTMGQTLRELFSGNLINSSGDVGKNGGAFPGIPLTLIGKNLASNEDQWLVCSMYAATLEQLQFVVSNDKETAVPLKLTAMYPATVSHGLGRIFTA